MRKDSLLALIALTAVPGIANAQLPGPGRFYLGAEIGYGSYIGRDTDGGEHGSLATGVRLGYDITRRLALEAVYTDHGEYGSGEGIACPGSCSPGTPAHNPVNTSARSQAVNLAGTWPLNERFGFRTVLGYTHLRAKLEDRSPLEDRALSQNRHGVILGAGIGARATANLDISLDWTLSLLSGKDAGTALARHLEGDVSMFSLGMRWRF